MRNNECLTFEEAMQQLEDKRATLSSLVLYALSAPSTEEIRIFRRQWPTLPVKRRRQVITALAENAEANFELDFNALFRVTMDDEDEHVRTLSVEGLWEDESVTLIAPLVHLLRKDKAASARGAAAASLGRFVLLGELEELDERYTTLVHGALLEAVADHEEVPEVRRRAVESIAYWDEPRVHDIIAAAYQEPAESMRISAVFAMGRSADPAWSETVCEELRNSSPAMRYEAARACGELEAKAAVPDLIKLVSDPDREVQFAAAGALGQIGGEKAKRVLERCARSSDEAMRLAAEDALAELELGRQPLDLLVLGLDDEPGDAESDDDEDIEDAD
jgi:HEAT repeat protein